MPVDMFERLRTDPGHRTLGELLQERQWALQEIERLRASSAAPSTPRRPGRPPNVVHGAISKLVTDPPTAPPPPHQMLRLPEVSTMVGLSRGCIYQMIARGQFPTGVHIGARARRWRMADITAWQEGLTN